MARRKHMEPDRLIAAAEIVLGVLRSLGGGLSPQPVGILHSPTRPPILNEFSDDEIDEACAFLRRLGVVSIS
jgi:hypothetical protein